MIFHKLLCSPQQREWVRDWLRNTKTGIEINWGIACSRLSDSGECAKSGEDAKVKGARKGVSYGVFISGWCFLNFADPTSRKLEQVNWGIENKTTQKGSFKKANI